MISNILRELNPTPVSLTVLSLLPLKSEVKVKVEVKRA